MNLKSLPRILFCLLIFFIFALGSCSRSSGLAQIDTSKKNFKLISKHGVMDFKKGLWKKSSSENRGKMLKSLFNKKAFVGNRNEIVFNLLGNSTCYINNEDQPCYEIIFDERFYFLVFSVYHSTDKAGTISNIEFFERD